MAALLDIDDFKFINDIYGHNYGDRALKNLADSMKTFFPSDALLGRNGGDEFCILYQIVPLQKQIYSCRNSPNFLNHSHTMVRNMHFIFL